jgi:hypothetical protein
VPGSSRSQVCALRYRRPARPEVVNPGPIWSSRRRFGVAYPTWRSSVARRPVFAAMEAMCVVERCEGHDDPGVRSHRCTPGRPRLQTPWQSWCSQHTAAALATRAAFTRWPAAETSAWRYVRSSRSWRRLVPDRDAGDVVVEHRQAFACCAGALRTTGRAVAGGWHGRCPGRATRLLPAARPRAPGAGGRAALRPPGSTTTIPVHPGPPRG